MRQIAKNVVAAGLAKRCEVQVAYAIGVAHPVSIMVDTFGTAEVDPTRSSRTRCATCFDMRPAAIIERLDLRRPIFRRTAAYGHFGRRDAGFTWEHPSRSEHLAAELRALTRSAADDDPTEESGAMDSTVRLDKDVFSVTFDGGDSSLRGWVVVDSLVDAMAMGGTRMTATVSQDEVRALAKCMTAKLTLIGLPLGGAKAGIIAGAGPREDTLRSFGRSVAPLLRGGSTWAATSGSTEADRALFYEAAG